MIITVIDWYKEQNTRVYNIEVWKLLSWETGSEEWDLLQKSNMPIKGHGQENKRQAFYNSLPVWSVS